MNFKLIKNQKSFVRLYLLVLMLVGTGCTPFSASLVKQDQVIGEDRFVPTELGRDIPNCSIELSEKLNRLGAPGAAVGAIKDGKLHCVSVAGLANIESNRPVEKDTVFGWASISKTVTATAAMVLYDDGRIDLDADINNYLSFSLRNPNCPSNPITLRQLMTHSSSILDNSNVYDSLYTQGDSPISLAEFIENYFEPGGQYYNANQNFSSSCPGTVNEYSNIGAGLIGYLVQEISGQPLDQFSRERIFRPLGMNEASFHLANLNVDNIAMDYLNGRPVGHIGFPTFPDGLFRTSLPQMAQIMVMMANEGNHNGRQILQASTVREMRRKQTPNLDPNQGLIWYYEGDQAFGHDGEEPGSSIMAYDPATRSGAIVVANGNFWESSTGEAEVYAIMSELYNQ